MQKYQSKLNYQYTIKAIKKIKDNFQLALSDKLQLARVSAPLFVEADSGINDGLNGEKAVNFDIPYAKLSNIEIIHSLAKWKRYELAKRKYALGYGIYTDMNAIRREEKLDQLHSVYVDQWDWELVIAETDRSLEFLRMIVVKIAEAIYQTQEMIIKEYPLLKRYFSQDVYFITSEQLLRMYPNKTAKEREYLICKKHGTVFVSQIGKKLSDGSIHDHRAADYDDWSLNGDLLVYYPIIDQVVELTSMGIRVDPQSLLKQLDNPNNLTPYQQLLVNNQLPLTVGGGIGQSRLCMLLLNKYHIAEVQSSIWDQESHQLFQELNIDIL